MKEQPTVIFTMSAGAVTLLSFFANLSVFLYDKAYMEMWHVDGIYISTSTPLRFYRTCIVFLFMVSTAYLYTVFRNDVLLRYIANWKKALISLCFFLFSCYCLLVTGGIPGEFAVFIGGVAILVVLTAVSMRFAIQFKIRIRCKREKETKKNSQVSESGCGTIKNDNEGNKGECDSGFTDKVICRYFANIIICCLLCLTGYLSLGAWNAVLEESFPVVYIGDRSYVAVYNTGDRMILEECDIEDGVIIQIYKEKQKIVSIEGIEYEILDYVPDSEIEPPRPSETEGTIEVTT